jgi:hypothetical protein
MNAETIAADPARVLCEVCSRSVLRSEALRSETHDEVRYFCGPTCYERRRGAGVPPPELHEVHGGLGRSKQRDERMKTLARQHPQRDEPRVDSVESDELPRP